MNYDKFELSIGTDAVTGRVRGQSAVCVATILGRQLLDDGRTRIWLDRLIHPGGDVTLGNGTELSGAISTIVTTPSTQSQP